MKVYSLYYKNKTFLGAFPSREDAVKYGQVYRSADDDGWDYDIVEEYLHKSPLTYTPPYTSLTPQQTIPCNPGITLIPGKPQTNPGTYPDIYCGVRAKDYPVELVGEPGPEPHS
jgi:hypothetical protein